MPIIGSLVGGIGSGLAGLFGGGQQQKTQTSGTISNTSSGTTNSSTNPNLSPLQQALINQFTQGASSLYNQSTNLKPYQASGLEQINNGSNTAATAIQANNAAHGLSFSPAAATSQNQNTLNRVNQSTQFNNSIPLLQRQLQQQSLGQLVNAFQVIPTGQTTNGTQTQSGTQTQQGTNLISGNPLAGAISGATSGGIAGFGLGNLYNNFQNNNGNNSSTSVPENQIQTSDPYASSNY